MSQQVAIARAISNKPRDLATPSDVQAAFVAVGLRRPPARFANEVLASVRGVAPSKTILDLLVDFRQHAIRSLSREFGGKTEGREDSLRNHLLTFLVPRGYAEANTGKGRTDILIPAPHNAVIETKVWTNMSTYRDGVEELGRYIHTEQPRQAYMVVFGDRDPLPTIIGDYRDVTASPEELGGLTVPVVVVPFEVDAPSKAAANTRRRTRG